ncbi:acyltransferase family protein [Azonexus hydrophilus]|uniref:Acyltransferase family protein n=1 Tax=Azonexus hydrophilus TaxID=418702 RepID=A0ABZ2XGC3_9RHOO
MHEQSNYRKDIDGLRAVAVISVVIFHAFPSAIQGGFIGVDIFFVISGFLITGILLDSLNNAKFDLLDFYRRRIRRIFPALTLVFAITLLVGALVLLPSEFALLGKHVARGSIFTSNFVLLNESGYFDTLAESKPLLHLWSLAIEEQFYIAWPILLYLAHKARLRIIYVTLALLVLSFAFGLWQINDNAAKAYFLPHSRFWELLVGASLAAAARENLNSGFMPSSKIQDCLSLAGLCFIVTGLFFISSSSKFPGWIALLPTLGTAFLIASGQHAIVNRSILSNKFAVHIGLISFPLYLWHWPLLSFLRIGFGETPSTAYRMGAVVLAVLLSFLTYNFVEKKIRPLRGSISATVLLITILTFGFLGKWISHEKGFPSRQVDGQIALSGELNHDAFFEYFAKNYHPIPNEKLCADALKGNDHLRCYRSKSDEKISMAIIGDSHGEHIFPAIAKKFNEENVAYFVRDGTPLYDSPSFEPIFEAAASNEAIETIVLATYWNFRIKQLGSVDTFFEKLLITVKRLQNSGKKVIVIYGLPDFEFDPTICKHSRPFFNTSTCSESANRNLQNTNNIQDALSDLQKKLQQPVVLFNLHNYFCDDHLCKMESSGQLLFRDRNHLTIEGSLFIGEQLSAGQ